MLMNKITKEETVPVARTSSYLIKIYSIKTRETRCIARIAEE